MYELLVRLCNSVLCLGRHACAALEVFLLILCYAESQKLGYLTSQNINEFCIY